MPSSSQGLLQESPFHYSVPFSRDVVYEISMRVKAPSNPFGDLHHAHRLVQALLQGQLLGRYRILDFLLWSEGLCVRVALQDLLSLSEFLELLKNPSGHPEPDLSFWDEILESVRRVAPHQLADSTAQFLDKAERLRQKLFASKGFSPGLFFFYRDPLESL